MPLLRIGNYIIYCGICLCFSTAAQAFTPKTIDVPMMGFTGYAFTPKTIDVPLMGFSGYASAASAFTSKTIEVPMMGFTGYAFTPKNIEVPMLGFTGFAFTPKTIDVPMMGFTGYGTAAAGSYGHVGPQAPVNTGLEGGSSINRGRLESLGMVKPDLAVLPQLSIGGSTTRWGGTVVLASQQVQPASNGLCSASLTYSIQNSGTAPSPAFTSAVLSSANQGQPVPSQWASLTPGTHQSKTEQVLLRPGQNSLSLYIDQAGQVDELNKTNNQARLQIILNGVCQSQYQQQQQYQPQQPIQQHPYQRQLPQRQLPPAVPSRQPGLF